MFGLVVSILCLLNFYHYSRQKEDLETKLITVVLFLDAFLIFIVFSSQDIDLLGFVNSVFSIIMFGSPLVNLVQVYRLKNAKGIISLQLALAGLVVSTLWVLLGLEMQDPFVIVPNFCGAILSAIQVLVCFYYQSNTSFTSVRSMEEH